jgi:transposase
VLYEAASGMLLRSKQWCSIKAWGVRIATTKRAVVALARKLAVIMHAMRRDGSEFRFAQSDDEAAATSAPGPAALAAAS